MTHLAKVFIGYSFCMLYFVFITLIMRHVIHNFFLIHTCLHQNVFHGNRSLLGYPLNSQCLEW